MEYMLYLINNSALRMKLPVEFQNQNQCSICNGLSPPPLPIQRMGGGDWKELIWPKISWNINQIIDKLNCLATMSAQRNSCLWTISLNYAFIVKIVDKLSMHNVELMGKIVLKVRNMILKWTQSLYRPYQYSLPEYSEHTLFSSKWYWNNTH